MNSGSILEIKNLTKIYKGSSIPAVDGLSLYVKENEIFGLLGPNGAGKTTTINIICGLIFKTSGNIEIAGFDSEKDHKQIKKLLGFVPQDIALYTSLTAFENLKIFGNIYGIEKNRLKNRINEMLEIFGLEKSCNSKVTVFSGGMKRRLNLITGLLHQPKILFLDEPTVGIDVQSKNMIIEYLKTLNREGTTMIYTSHYLEEAENFCSHIAIMDQGKSIVSGSPKELINQNTECSSLEDVFLKLTGKKLRD